MENRYAIKDLEGISGVKSHTIRMWEQRYALFTPKRTETNIRYYDNEDLRKLLKVGVLNRNGIKISKIAKMSSEEMDLQVAACTSGENEDHRDQITSLKLAMLELDEVLFEKVLSSNILKFGFEETMLEIVYPFLRKVGDMWLYGSVSPAQEHFISNLIRQKIIVAIDAIPIKYTADGKSVILFSPIHEHHELGLLFASYVFKKRGVHTIYLGSDVPMENVKEVYESHQPSHVFCAITATPSAFEVQKYINELAQDLKKAQLVLTGLQVHNTAIEMPKNAMVMKTMADTTELANQLGQVSVRKVS